MSFDLNIQNYRPEDVVALFKLPTTFCDADVDEKAEAIRMQLFTEDMPSPLKDEISMFLDAARDLIKRDWVAQPPGREDLISRPALPFIPSKHEEFTKGDFNPYAKRTMTKMASVDTLFRTNSSTTRSTDFAYVLPESIRNVMSMRLASIELPNMINTFSQHNKSNIFYFHLYNRATNNSIPFEQPEVVTITIPDGNYTADSMVTTMNKVIQQQGCDFIIFEIIANNKCVFRTREIGEGISPFDVGEPYSSPDFRFEIDFLVPNKLLCTLAGWNLGFRNPLYNAEGTLVYEDLANGTYHNYIVSESSFGSSIDNYLFLEVDDFHNNFQTDTVISTNATSYLGKNILARIVLNTGIYTRNSANDGMFKKREYLGPVRLEKLHFRLLNKFGEVVDLTNNDFSFSLEFVTIYS